MIIDAINIHWVKMPLVYPFRTAFGDFVEIESLLVKMVSGDDCGWGEASPWASPTYSPEWTAGAFALVRDWLAPQLVGREISSGEELQHTLSIFKGNPFAKASLDLAWWDLYARQLDKPLWRVLGGHSPKVEVGADFGVMEDIDLLLVAIDEALRAGFKRIKLKYRPGWEVEMMATVRRAFPKAIIHVDCNSAYSLADAEMFKELEAYDLAMIEQPLAFDDLYDHSKLQKMLHTPICLDESITSPDKARQAIELKACGWINIKPGRVGGLTNAMRIHDICYQAGLPVWIGGMLESAVGAMHCLALATLPGVAYPSDIFPSSRFYREDLAHPAVEMSDLSTIRANPGAGIACQPLPERLRALTVDRSKVVAR
jgi:O-succinylbenzoate synthase